MKTTLLSKTGLITFENDIADLLNDGQIHAPVHLVGGNEANLLEIFKQIKRSDWVFSTHRNHYHALLKHIPEEWLRKEILEGRSICIQNPEYNFYTSAIVGGNLPQAVGVALAGERVWVFCGDMAAETGIFYECVRFSKKNGLPITFIVEDNGLSVLTPTRKVCASSVLDQENIIRYNYKNTWPHQGAGKNVVF